MYNIGLEGMLLSGAFGAATGAYFADSPVAGLMTGLACGLAAGLVLASLTIVLGVDQFVSGIAVNLLALGLTAFLARIVFAGHASTTILPGFKVIPIWGLDRVPIIGPAFFRQDSLVYLLYVLVPLLSVFLNRTRWGLSIRAIGESPLAADAAGLPVNRIRFACVVTSCLASFGGLLPGAVPSVRFFGAYGARQRLRCVGGGHTRSLDADGCICRVFAVWPVRGIPVEIAIRKPGSSVSGFRRVALRCLDHRPHRTGWPFCSCPRCHRHLLPTTIVAQRNLPPVVADKHDLVVKPRSVIIIIPWKTNLRLDGLRTERARYRGQRISITLRAFY